MKESTIMGRVAVHVPDHPAANNRGYILKARYVMEQYLGRYLNSDEEVHHKDLNKLNDELDNLQLMTKEEHARLHANMRGNSLDYEWLRQLIVEGLGYKKISKVTGYPIPSVKSAVRKIRGCQGSTNDGDCV